MRQWRNGAGNAPRHYAGTRPTAGRALSRTRSLTAAAIAVAMMATVAVTSLLPAYNAKADESGLKNGSTCTPSSIGLGDDTSVTGSDTGVATYVGGDMYVGGKPSDANALNNSTGPTGTYAVEAEGLTVVNGSLAMHPLKDAWKVWNTSKTGGKYYTSRGFRWGVVGFGSQFRPADGKTALVVGGNTNTSVMSSNVGAWRAPGWLGKTDVNDINSHEYKASLAGNKTGVWGSNDSIDSVRGLSGNNVTEGDITPTLGTDTGLVTWNQYNNLSNVNGMDYSKYGEKISKLSTDLNTGTKLPATGKVTTSNAPSDDSYTIYKYDYRKNGNKGNSFTFYGGQLEHEKLITFTSTDTSKSMQVFNLPASYLNLGTEYTGIDFKFVNIPDNASVVINVTGAQNQTIDFHNGWRFWWNYDNIANDFVTAATTDTDYSIQKTKNNNYAKRAQQIMWNFADAQNVVIRGGQATGKITVSNHTSDTNANHGAWGTTEDMKATDDPSAAWMGSILVPNGNLQSHVSTNGRVWVGGDFEMLNNETVKKTSGLSTDHPVDSEFLNESGEKTTSILDMDQERHNLPWNGSYSTSCAAIAWDKVDESGNALGGTSWTVYGKKDDAVNGTNALATIADDGWNDDADAKGSFQLGNLAKNGTYFLKESGTVEGYAQNTNIYQINTGDTTEAAKKIVHIFNSNGIEIAGDTDKLLTDGKIVNKKTGSSITWQKVDGTDQSTLLAGSTWTLSKMNGNTAEQSWNITDDQSGTEVKSITITDASGNVVASDMTITFEGNNSQTFTATAYDQQNQVITGAKLTWSSNNATVASVDQNGTVTPTGNGDATITVKSADGKATASFTVKVSGVEASVSITGYSDGEEISLVKGETLNLTAIAKPKGNTVEWSTSSPDNVSLSTIKGLEVTLTANKVTSSSVSIKAKETRTGKTVTLKVNVTAKPYLTLYFDAQNQGQWSASNVQVYYKDANNSWSAKNMSPMSGACSRYAYVNLPLTGDGAINASSEFGFRTTGGSGWYSPAAKDTTVPKALNDNGGYNFKFTNDSTLPEVVVISAGPSYSTIAPSGCAVTSTAAYSSRRVTSRSGEHRAVSAVLRAQGSVLNAVNETVSTKVDEDTAAGKFKVSDLVDGTYHLQETKAPNGYDLSNTVYTITITGGNVTWNPDVTDSKIANTRKTGSVTWTKVSSDTNNSEPLSGSEWTLKQTKTFSWVDGVAKYTDATSDATLGTVTDCVDGQNAKCSTQTSKYVDLDGAAGKLQISGLDWGEYQLIESKAPDGYDLDTTPHTFRIGPLEGDNIAGDWYANTDFNTEGTSAYNEQTTFTVNGGNIKNKPGVILPGTGGAGDYWIYAAALVAALIGVVAAGMALKVRRRQ